MLCSTKIIIFKKPYISPKTSGIYEKVYITHSVLCVFVFNCLNCADILLDEIQCG